MQYEVTTMYLTGDIGVCPKAARACPNPRGLHILRPHFFPEPEIFRDYSPHYLLPFLKFLAKSNEAISRK